MARLDAAQRQWLGSGLVGAMTTVDAAGGPTIVRVFAHGSGEDGAQIDFYIARSDAARTLANLATQPLAALNLVCPRTYRSIQFKGPCEPLPGEPSESFLQRQRAQANEALGHVGMPPGTVQRLLSRYTDPSLVGIRMQLRELFDQSPGPRAGERL